jgi:hypothetical protein
MSTTFNYIPCRIQLEGSAFSTHSNNNTMTKDTLDLMAAVQRAYDRVLHTQDKAARIFDFSEEETFYMKLDEAYDAYDALVDSLVESTGGNASAVNTDPLTFYDIKHKDKNMTYNEMAEVVGQAAFGG